MNANTHVKRYTQADARTWVGKHVHTTDGYHGVVLVAHPAVGGGTIILDVQVSSWSIRSDNEHASIVRS